MSFISRIRNRLSTFGKKESYAPRESFALNSLDLKLQPYLNFRRGFFVEAGANDGIAQSNTLYFERYQDWKGLLVEPVPELAAKCRLNRPQCIVENCALVSTDFDGDAATMRYANLMSLVTGALKSRAEEEEHIRVGCEIQNVQSYELRVPVATLSELLDRHRVNRVDLLSLDVEGYELDVLKGLDLKRHRPRFMMIEARFRDEIDEYLAPNYKAVAELSHHDVLYVSKS